MTWAGEGYLEWLTAPMFDFSEKVLQPGAPGADTLPQRGTNTMSNTYEITTSAGRTHRVEDALSHQEAARIVLASEKIDSAFANDLARQALGQGSLSDRQAAWLHVFASWAASPAVQVELLFHRVAEMFRSAVDAGKARPRVYLSIAEGDRVVLKLSQKGRINVTDGRPYGESRFYGSIGTAGDFRPGRDLRDEVRTLLSALEADPVRVIADYGRQTGHCSFCGLELTDRRSLHVGYGPICADKHGLPWGEVPEEAAS